MIYYFNESIKELNRSYLELSKVKCVSKCWLNVGIFEIWGIY